jgi:probable F420-dependent oxidoreductase
VNGPIFGLNIAPSGGPGADPIEDAVSANDHMHGPDPRLEAWTMLSWIAASTSRIRVATRVLGVPYRNPAVVAKMAETFDRLSGGRLILGLGGGASDDEFRALGLPTPSPRDKVDGLDEAIRIMRGLWSEPTFMFAGMHHRTDGAQIEPKPDHAIPIWLGTYGPRALGVTGRLADGWIPSLELAPPDRIPSMLGRIREAATAAGRDPGDVTAVYNLEVRVDPRADPDPFVVSGSPEKVATELLVFVDLGFAAFNFIPIGPDPDEQAELLAREVLPLVRAGR